MIILTSQDAALVDCCDCPAPECVAPRKECQSLTVNACGYSLPDITLESGEKLVPAEDRCKIYRTKTDSQTGDSDSSDSDYFGGTYTSEGSRTEIQINKSKYTGVGLARICEGALFSISFTETGSETITYPITDPLTPNYETTSSYSSLGDGVSCSGSYTITQTGSATDSGAYNVCTPISLSPENTWSYSAGVFTTSYSNTTTVGTTSSTDAGTLTVTYSEPFTVAMLETEIDLRISQLVGEAAWGGTTCFSSVASATGRADPPDPEADPLPVMPVVCTQVNAATKSRYKIGIPGAWADFDGRHAAWLAADPETRGPEPIERTYFSAQWDEVFFPLAWEQWKILKDAFDAATAEHEEWEACTADCGPEPTVPDDPGAAPSPAPSLVASRSWSYGGTDEFSGWFTIALPTVVGQTRVVNMLTKCHQNSRLGVKPTATGEIYEL